MGKPVGVLRFHGTNCDQDVFTWVKDMGGTPQWVDGDQEFNPSDFSALMIPGGFSYGDYLRCGALAARSKAMESVKKFAASGGFVLGICNGFQVLCEAGLLPGALLRNNSGKFRDDFVTLDIANNFEVFPDLNKGQKIKIPIAHGEGRFVAEERDLQKLKSNGQVWLRYQSNPNGSMDDIAGVCNETKNVFGLMPHPERSYFDWMDSEDGRLFRWKSS